MQIPLVQTASEPDLLTARLLQAQYEERRRVARELHDGLSQRLAKLQFDIEDLHAHCLTDPASTPNRLECLRQQIGDLADEVRSIAHGLHPSTIDNLGLAVAIRSYCRDFSTRSGIPVRVRIVDVPRRVPPDIGNPLYRIVQEALGNVAKHAGRASATVTLKAADGDIHLRVRDNGCGFPAESAGRSGGIGLVSMEERVLLMKGKFDLVSLPNRGVTITIRVPLAPGGRT